MNFAFKPRHIAVSLAFAVLFSALLYFLYPTAPKQAGVTAPTSLSSGSTPRQLSGGLEEYVPEGLFKRDLIFYPPGMAPSEELEFNPVPFEDLLPKTNTEGFEYVESK